MDIAGLVVAKSQNGPLVKYLTVIGTRIYHAELFYYLFSSGHTYKSRELGNAQALEAVTWLAPDNYLIKF